MATITAAARTVYPHDALPDDVYARVADKLAEAARGDSGTARMIEDGVSAVNGGRPFAELSPDEQLETLKGIESSDFFELVRSTAVVEVYCDQRTWQLVGYEGPSFGKGGYINRVLTTWTGFLTRRRLRERAAERRPAGQRLRGR